MILSDVRGTEVRVAVGTTAPEEDEPAGEFVGHLVDVRFAAVVGEDGRPGRPRITGLVISPRRRTSFLGYERSDMRRPWPIASFERWYHRESFVAAWQDVLRFGPDRILLRRGFTEGSVVLDAARTPRQRPEREHGSG